MTRECKGVVIADEADAREASPALHNMNLCTAAGVGGGCRGVYCGSGASSQSRVNVADRWPLLYSRQLRVRGLGG